MKILSEETFGPVLPIIPFDTEEEVVLLANKSNYGLSSSVWTSDQERARRIAKKLLAGNVVINDVSSPWLIIIFLLVELSKVE